VSFPVGELIGFDADLSVRSNVAHVARLYGADVKTTVAFVERVAKLGPAFDKRSRELTGTARTELGQILTYSIPFDLYLLNREAASPKNLQNAAFALLEARIAQSAGMIVAVGQPAFARDRCEMGLVLHDGQLMAFAEVEQALSVAKLLQEEESAPQ
jgi:capsular polysaccharide transport system ATP-binding protein